LIEPPKRRWLPPWTIILPQIIWAWAVYGFAYFALTRQSWSHWMMTALSFTLVVGLYFRSRIAFWLSAIGFAMTVGGNLARLEFIQSAPISLSINLLFSIGMLVLHQTAPSLRWFGFRNPRQVRGSLWGLSILVIVLAEMLMPLPRR
jgi:hypothetical protein